MVHFHGEVRAVLFGRTDRDQHEIDQITDLVEFLPGQVGEDKTVAAELLIFHRRNPLSSDPSPAAAGEGFAVLR